MSEIMGEDHLAMVGFPYVLAVLIRILYSIGFSAWELLVEILSQQEFQLPAVLSSTNYSKNTPKRRRLKVSNRPRLCKNKK